VTLRWIISARGAAPSEPAAVDGAPVLRLSARSVDTELESAFRERRGADNGPVTTAELFAALDDDGGSRGLVLANLDALQAPGDGVVTDVRLRLLLESAARERWADAAIVVSSRRAPPPSLAAAGVVPEERDPPALDVRDLPRATPVLEALAAGRAAMPGWLLGLVAGESRVRTLLDTPPAVLDALEEPLRTGLVQRCEDLDGEWFQLSDAARGDLLDPTRSATVGRAVVAALRSDEARKLVEVAAERRPGAVHDLLRLAIILLVAVGETEEAVSVYWRDLGNFSSLFPSRRCHLGAEVCRLLNEGRDPDRVEPGFAAAEGGWAVLNDWGQFARCVGDTTTAVAAARSSYESADQANAMDRALLARHLAEVHVAAGRLPQAHEWATRAWIHATEASQETQGIPTMETMRAFDDAAAAAIAVVSRMGDAADVRRELDALVAAHERARRVLQYLGTERLVIPIPEPGGPTDPEELEGGRPAAVLALLEDRPADVRRLLQRADGSFAQWSDGVLAARASVADDREEELPELLSWLEEDAERRDDLAGRCECAELRSALVLRQGRADDALHIVDDHLPFAARLGLGLAWIDLLVARSGALLALGRDEEARAAAAAALHGPSVLTDEPRHAPAGLLPITERFSGAADPACAYHAGARSAIRALRAAGGQVDDAIAGASRGPAPAVAPPVRVPPERPLSPGHRDPNEQRAALHHAARELLEAYEQRGLPFVLSFRTYGVEIFHGPFEGGPQYVETMLRRALPPEAGVLAVQDHGGGTYFGSGTFEDRATPSLLLADEDWQEAVESLIPYADLIVSECYFLTPGVRFELDAVQRHRTWDRTVLILPPLESMIATLDNDPLIQMFPRCVWADELHQTPLVQTPQIEDLLHRIRDLAALADAVRSQLTDPAARRAAHPVDLLGLAIRLESRVMAQLALGGVEEPRERYYAFWTLFRAAALRAAADATVDTVANETSIINDYLRMSELMLDHETDEDRIVLIGDLDFAEKLVSSAFNLAKSLDVTDWFRQHLTGEAEAHWENIQRVRQAIASQPDRFILRPRYGPFVVTRTEHV
jgi:hypothetical protein